MESSARSLGVEVRLELFNYHKGQVGLKQLHPVAMPEAVGVGTDSEEPFYTPDIDVLAASR